jgi:hypothetical protein
VRVEGKTKNLYGATGSSLSPFIGTLKAEDGTPVELTKPNVLGALEAASLSGGFFYNLQQFSFGSFVSQVGRVEGRGLTGWFFKVNGRAPQVGATEFKLKSGDDVLWYWAKLDAVTFAGPPTLDIIQKGRCVVAREFDAAGKRTRASNVKFKLDERRRVRSQSGRVCPPKWTIAQAVRPGAVRSQVIVAS